MTLPANAVQIQGQGSVSADNLNTYAQWVANLTQLRGFTGVANMTVLTLGDVVPNDGGQGRFYWDASSTAADNNSTVIRPAGVTLGAWIKQQGAGAVQFPTSGTINAVCGSNYVALGSITMQLPAASTAGTSCIITAFAYGGSITLLPAGSDQINDATPGGDFIVRHHYSTTVTNNGISKNYATAVPSGVGSEGAIGGVNGLRISNNSGIPTTVLDVVADQVLITDGLGHNVRLNNFFQSINASTVGLNGLDVGSLAPNQWYYAYIIGNVDNDGTVISGGILSLSSVTPTLPSTYTLFIRVGAVRTEGLSHFLQVRQVGNHAQYIVGVDPADISNILIASGASGDPTVPTWTAFSVANFIPPTAHSIDISLHNGAAVGGECAVAPNAAYNPVFHAPMFLNLATGTGANIRGIQIMQGVNIYYTSNDSASFVVADGWIDNLSG